MQDLRVAHASTTRGAQAPRSVLCMLVKRLHLLMTKKRIEQMKLLGRALTRLVRTAWAQSSRCHMLYSVCALQAGFGADIGLEKFMNIKCRASGLKPDAAGGASPDSIMTVVFASDAIDVSVR